MSDVINRRGALGRLAGVGAGIILATALPSILEAAPVDPVDAAYAELVDASLAWERSRAETGDIGAGILPWVRRVAGLDRRLQAAYGEEIGSAMWTAAMHRHRRWQIARYGLLDDA